MKRPVVPKEESCTIIPCPEVLFLIVNLTQGTEHVKVKSTGEKRNPSLFIVKIIKKEII